MSNELRETSGALAVLESDIPSDHPDKIAIEDAIRSAFASASGRWRAGILLVQGAPWWVAYVHDLTGGLRRSALLDSQWKQTPASVMRVVRELMDERRHGARILGNPS